METYKKYLKESFKKGDRVKFVSGSDYAEPNERNKTFKVTNVRGNEIEINGSYYPKEEFYKI